MKRFYYKLNIQYVGTNYLGWQIQDEKYGKTIQGELNKALKLISKCHEIKSMASGRTDAKVHALNQVIKVDIPLEIGPQNLLKAINSNTPSDILVLDVEKVTKEFHPIKDSLWKEYIYIFSSSLVPSPFLKNFVASYPFSFDIKAIEGAIDVFIGCHDFCNYHCVGSQFNTSIKNIIEFEIIQGDSLVPWLRNSSDLYTFRIRGDGFLKQMVRLIVGTLWMYGRGKFNLDTIKSSLSGIKSDYKLGFVAPPEGLYLNRVQY